MTEPLTASSISRPVHELLRPPRTAERDHSPWTGRAAAVFEHACTLMAPNGDVVTVVTPSVGNGPLNIVLARETSLHAHVRRGTPAVMRGTCLQAGRLALALQDAAVWEPCPDWVALREQRAAIEGRLPRLREIALRLAPADSLLAPAAAWYENIESETGFSSAANGGTQAPRVFPGLRAWERQPRQSRPSSGVSLSVSARAHKAALSLSAGWDGDRDQLVGAAEQLAGLGGGLTPAGDDFLAGAMLWAWLAHPFPRRFGRLVADTAAPRTTSLSAAWLQAAAEGQCSAPWHQLLAALSHGGELAPPVRRILALGATSGADTLGGFLWIGREGGVPVP